MMRAASLAAIALPALLLLVPRILHAADAPPPLVLERSIPLDKVAGRIDHMAFDPRRKRLIVAELGNGTVDVIDLAAGRALHRLGGLKEPQGVAYVPASDMIAVASAGDGTLRLFRAEDFAPAGVVSLGEDADNLRLDPKRGEVVVGYGDGGLAWIDAASAAKRAEVRLPAHPESFRFAPAGDRIFVNLPDSRLIAAVDARSRKVVARWKQGHRANFPMAVSGDGALLASVFRSPPRLVLIDTSSGAPRADVESCGDADDVFFDEKRRRVYVSCGSGAVDVFRRDGATLARLARVATSSGARTALFVPALDRLYVAARAGLIGGSAAILVMRPEP